jgi:hypothetical protein
MSVRQVAGCCEHGNEPSEHIRFEEFLRKCATPWSYLGSLMFH